MKIGQVDLAPPFALAPMAGMTDTAFRRLVKRKGGCGLVVTEMVSSEGLVRGIDRTLEYAEYTEEERPVSIQIFGGDPAKMADAAQIVEGMGADIVDINMGCPVPKIAKHNAGCSLMREPEHAQAIVAAMVMAVRIPVTVKMRAGWTDAEINAPELARRMADAGAAAVAVHGRTAAQSYSGVADWDLIARVADDAGIPVFGSGDCVEPEDIVLRLRAGRVSGVLVGRGALRNPWVFEQAAAIARGERPRQISLPERGQFLLDYIDLLVHERTGEAVGFRHVAPTSPAAPCPTREAAAAPCPTREAATAPRPTGEAAAAPCPTREAGAAPCPTREAALALCPTPERGAAARGHDRWVINKVRALNSWYTKGIDNGSHLRVAVNAAESLPHLRAIIEDFFFSGVRAEDCAPQLQPSLR